MTREDIGTAEYKVVQVGNYRFTGKNLGKGSFGTVEEAVHIYLDVKVSVKKIDLLRCNSYVLKNLKREAKILHQLHHPYILRLFEVISYGNMYCLVTELVCGGDLCAFLRNQRCKHLDEKTTRRFSRQIIEALCYLHKKGIIHRDLKLENIMLAQGKVNIKLVDFGLSNSWKVGSPLKTLCGSPEYSAPELFTYGTHYGPEVDMWALGVIMYAMAVGQLPFPGVSVMIKDPEKKVKFLETINKGLSDSLTDSIIGFSKDFVVLIKGLMNPKSAERLSVDDVIKNVWVLNKNRWASVSHGSLDSYDVNKIALQLCSHLGITEEKLRSDLKSKPFGDTAGYYNIMVYKYNHPKDKEMPPFSAKFSNHLVSETKKIKPNSSDRKEKGSKIWVIGTARKINDVMTGKKILQKNVRTCSISTSSRPNTCKAYLNKIEVNDLRYGAGDWSSSPRTDTSKTTNSYASSSSTPKGKNIGTIRSIKNEKITKLKAEMRVPILPSKAKLRSSVCKFYLKND